MVSEIQAKPYADFKGGERSLAVVTKPGERAAGKDKLGQDKYLPYAAGDLVLIDNKRGMVITGPVGRTDVFNIAMAVLNGNERTLTESHNLRALAMYAVFKLGEPRKIVPAQIAPAASAEVHQAQDEIRTSFGDGTEG